MSVCLNIGCKDIKIEGFINLDIDEKMLPDRIQDCTKLRKAYQANSVDFIYCGHFLEHFKISTSMQIVCDFYYILKEYGSICCVVPDYLKVPLDIDEAERIILGAGEHVSLFSEDRLLLLLRTAGFTPFPVNIKDVPWTPFSDVMWQSAVFGIKNSAVRFR